jgi:hypothetical protein
VMTVNINQTMMAVVAVVAAAVLIWRHRPIASPSSARNTAAAKTAPASRSESSSPRPAPARRRVRSATKTRAGSRRSSGRAAPRSRRSGSKSS